MNILIPHSWLLEQLKTEASPKKIQQYLSLCGPSVERVNKIGKDWVYDIEVTTNRVDSMSVRGIAREAAVILPQFDVPAKLVKNTLTFASVKPDATKRLPLPKIRNGNKLKRIVCVVLSNVERTPTPKWMAERLTAVDMNVHDSTIDITNYITHELGHPVHAFDYDKIMALGGEIVITTARKGETFTTLDGASYTAVGGEVVYKNPDGVIIDLPAIKGTLNSAVDNTTKNILLWMESVDPAKVRFASMTHAIRTVAAQISEKGVDPNLMEPTLVRGIELYEELCHATVASDIYDLFPARTKPTPIVVDVQKIHAYLGVELPMSRIVSILEKLEFAVKIVNTTLHVTPPTFRQTDVEIAEDIVEEIARIYGYHNLPSVVMPTRIPLTYPTDVNFRAENTIKHFLAAIGWQEVYTYSMVSEALATESGYTLTSHVTLANPLTDDKVYLRRSLLPSLAEVIAANPLVSPFSVFELANTYAPQSVGLPKESLRLAMASTKPFREAKGDLEALLRTLYITDLSIENETGESAGKLLVGKNAIGTLAVNGNLTQMEIEMAKLLPLIHRHPTYQPLPKTASVVEHMTFTFPPQTAVGPVITAMQKLDRRIKSVTLHDVYQANCSFAVEYWDAKTNLSNEDVRPLRKQIVTFVEKTYRAKLVGAVQ